MSAGQVRGSGMRLALAALFAVAVAAAGCPTAPARAGSGGKAAGAFDERALPPEQQQNYRTFTRACGGCHKPEKVLRSHVSSAKEWAKIVDRMSYLHGARLSKEDRPRVLAFLAYVTEASQKGPAGE